MKKLLMILSLALLAGTQVGAVTSESATHGITVWFTSDEYWDLFKNGRDMKSMIRVGMTSSEANNQLSPWFSDMWSVMMGYFAVSATYVVVEVHDDLGGYDERGPGYRWGFTLKNKDYL